MLPFPLLVILYAGFMHAFEADHLLAVTNIVTRRAQVLHAVKDGIFWGLGHTFTLFLVGMGLFVFKMNIPPSTFRWFDAAVGAMLIALGAYRLTAMARRRDRLHQHTPGLAYGVGMVHGLAGSGALVVLVMMQTKTAMQAVAYVLIFGAGSLIGMLAAVGAFSAPLSRVWLKRGAFQATLALVSSVLCIGYGGWVIYQSATR